MVVLHFMSLIDCARRPHDVLVAMLPPGSAKELSVSKHGMTDASVKRSLQPEKDLNSWTKALSRSEEI